MFSFYSFCSFVVCFSNLGFKVFSLLVIASQSSVEVSKKANMLYMSKEMTNKDNNIKMQMYFASDSDDSKGSKKIWDKDGFFGEQRSDLTLLKTDFLENLLVYVNQGTVSTVKGGDQTIYLVNIVLGQVISLANSPPDIEDYICQENEAKMLVPLYDVNTGDFKGVEKRLGLIVVCEDLEEYFLSYGFDKVKSKLLFSTFKKQLPNIFQSTCFKKHKTFLTNENKGEQSRLFYYLPSTTDRKESINQHMGHVQVHPIDCIYEDFKNHSPNNSEFMLHDLELIDQNKKETARETVVRLLHQAIEVSNSNLTRNANTLIMSAGSSDKIVGLNDNPEVSQKFKVTY